jgi:hypothetical protein
MDCEDGTRIFGGGTRLKMGEGEFGWLRYCWLSIFLVSKARACLGKGAVLETQNEKLARVFNRWALWSYSTNLILLASTLEFRCVNIRCSYFSNHLPYPH